MKFESTLDFFILFIVFIKIVFLLSALGNVLLTHIPVSISKTIGIKDSQLLYWKERTEFIFIVSMAVLLVYHFRPGHLKPISDETSLLFFLFGCILIITSKWNLFFTEAAWYKKIAQSLQ